MRVADGAGELTVVTQIRHEPPSALRLLGRGDGVRLAAPRAPAGLPQAHVGARPAVGVPVGRCRVCQLALHRARPA